MPAFAEVIDWKRPWLKPFLPVASAVLQSPDWRVSINALAIQAGLRNHRGLPIQFVPQSELPIGTPYEAFISHTGKVPTRENLHDFLNALVWLIFPQTKVQLNALQATEIFKEGKGIGDGRRGKLRDAATIFDESGAIVVAKEPSFIESLRGHSWEVVFLEKREGFGRDWEVFLFGHALMEKLVQPYKAITAHAYPFFPLKGDDFPCLSPQTKTQVIDEALAQKLSPDFTTLELSPLPVLGVPGWWLGQDKVFYQDPAVFRPKRIHS